MTSWQTATIIGLVGVAFYLGRLIEDMKDNDESGFFGTLLTLVNMGIFTVILRICIFIAREHNSNVEVLLNNLFVGWVIVYMVILVVMVFYFMPRQWLRRNIQKKKERGLYIENNEG